MINQFCCQYIKSTAANDASTRKLKDTQTTKVIDYYGAHIGGMDGHYTYCVSFISHGLSQTWL